MILKIIALFISVLFACALSFAFGVFLAVGKDRRDEWNGCRCCLNARVYPGEGLDDSNDFSSHAVGDWSLGYSMMINAGHGEPVNMEYRKWNGTQWETVGVYKPKYCPECGRRLNEYGGHDVSDH